MKKLVFILCIAVFAISTVLIIFIIKYSNKTTTFPQRGITLNGILSGDADEMVLSFKNDKKCKIKKTAVWLDSAWVSHIYNIICKEYGDGIRIYFAKTKDGKKNTVVIVSTYRIGPDNKAESGSDHEDYYDHSDLFFNTTAAALTPVLPNDQGALLFAKTCPCKGEDCLLVSSDEISCKKAYDAVQNLINTGDNETVNTNSEWFSLNRIKGIMNEMKEEHENGVHIYYAKHTKITTANDKHQNRYAFIIVPTKRIPGTNYNIDYFGCPGHSVIGVNFTSNDNGEQCLNNCSGNTLPAN